MLRSYTRALCPGCHGTVHLERHEPEEVYVGHCNDCCRWVRLSTGKAHSGESDGQVAGTLLSFA